MADDITQSSFILLGEVLDPGIGVNARLRQDLVGAGATDPVNIGEGDLDSLIRRQVNAGKSKVVPFSRPFRFCKAKFQVTDTGAVKIHGCRDGMKRARRKLRLFQARVASGEMTVEQVAQWLQTPISYYENFNDHGRVLKLRRLFYAIFKTEV